MGIYNDLANDSGYAYGTEENEQIALMIEQEEYEEYHKWQAWKEEEKRHEILFRKFK
ncbi:MAG: hypothetical protein ACFFG0_00905 [Candidatus Thorarchaeota archaeon]